ncbi:hypothetical protein BH23ACT10_BH23ACT10_32370 [soil metagenome]
MVEGIAALILSGRLSTAPAPHVPPTATRPDVRATVLRGSRTTALRGFGSGSMLQVALGVFIGFQLVVINAGGTGPFLDEGIYITAGLRTFDGFGLADGYLTWFAGSLAWPVVTASAYRIGGLAASRACALLFVAVGLTTALQATAELHGRRVALMSALVLLSWGPALALAHLAVYDTLAIAGVGVALLGVVRLQQRDHRGWIVLAATSLAIAVVAKYPALLCAGPLAALVIATRRRRALIDLVVFTIVLAALAQMFFLPLREELSAFLTWRLDNDPTFGVTMPMVAAELTWLMAIPLPFALAGARIVPARRTAIALLSGLAVFPMWHLWAGNIVGASKHMVFGAVLAAPLIGVPLARMSTRRSRMPLVAVIAVVLAVGGIAQMRLLDRRWPDTRPAADYLAEHVDHGDTILTSNAWTYTAPLYSAGVLGSPWDVYDVYRERHGQIDGSVCGFDWFVDEHSGYGWPERVRTAVEACNSYEPVLRSTTPVTDLNHDLRFHTFAVVTTVWRNTTAERS